MIADFLPGKKNITVGHFLENVSFIYLSASSLTCGMWDLSSMTKDGTRAPYIGSVESKPLYYQVSPGTAFLKH